MTQDPIPLYHGEFGGLWIDRLDAPALLEKRVREGGVTADEATSLSAFMQRGWVLLEGAVPSDVIDRLLAEHDRAWETCDPRYRVAVHHSSWVPPEPHMREMPTYRLVDVYAHMESARRAMFAPRLRRFLDLIFDREPLAFQGLSFEHGSEQDIHQDPAYVVVSSPLELTAAWIALEDVREGSGELIYYEGSHRLPDFVFGEHSKHWNPRRDGDAVHARFLAWLYEASRERGLPLRTLRCRKGDVLVWHGNLAHGGARIIHADRKVTRRSFVVHYCPLDVWPYYFHTSPDRRTVRPAGPGMWYASWHYDLALPAPAAAKSDTVVFAPPASPPPRSRLVELVTPIVPSVVRRFVRSVRRRALPLPKPNDP